MKFRMLLATIIAVVCVAGCSGTSASHPPTAAGSSSSLPVASTSSSAASPTPSVVGTAAREAADRLAVAAAWTKFWGVYVRLHGIPATQLQASVDSVATGVTKTQMLNEVKVFTAGHKTSYGDVINHPYWPQLIAGMSTAVLGDCMDQSHFGSASTETKAKLTVGVAHDNTQATLVKGANGLWRVQLIKYLLDVKC